MYSLFYLLRNAHSPVQGKVKGEYEEQTMPNGASSMQNEANFSYGRCFRQA